VSELAPFSHDGVSYQPVLVARSRPFAAALLEAWRGLDGTDRRRWLSFKSFNVPSEIYARLAPGVRAQLEGTSHG